MEDDTSAAAAAPFRVPQAATALSCSEQAIRRAIRRGHIHANKLGRGYLIPASEIARLTGEAIPA